MAIVFSCDGCGTVQGKETFTARGHIIKRHYCEGCLVEADSYLASRDTLHNRLAQEWGDELALLTKAYSNKKFLLPDVPQPELQDDEQPA